LKAFLNILKATLNKLKTLKVDLSMYLNKLDNMHHLKEHTLTSSEDQDLLQICASFGFKEKLYFS
jgi:hypothetical protein